MPLFHRCSLSTVADDFLLGGHSLNASQLQIRVQETFGVQLQLHTILSSTNFAQMTDSIRALMSTSQSSSALAAFPASTLAPLAPVVVAPRPAATASVNALEEKEASQYPPPGDLEHKAFGQGYVESWLLC